MKSIEYQVYPNPFIPSHRYRVMFPLRHLQKLKRKAFMQAPINIDAKQESERILPTGDIVVFGKCITTKEQHQLTVVAYANAVAARMQGQTVVYDLTDHHYKKQDWFQEQRMIGIANIVTCSTTALISQLREYMPRFKDKFVHIPDAQLYPNLPIHSIDPIGKLLWFGSTSSFADSFRLFYGDNTIGRADGRVDLGTMPPPWGNHPIEIVMHPQLMKGAQFHVPNITATPWDLHTMEEWMGRNDIAVLPLDLNEPNHRCKSHVRTMEAVAFGLYVVGTPVESTRVFEGWLGFTGNLYSDVSIALHNPHRAEDSIQLIRELIDERFSQEKVGELWNQVLS